MLKQVLFLTIISLYPCFGNSQSLSQINKESIFTFHTKKTIKESFSLRILPDNAWVLQFKKNGEYEYYHWSGFGGANSLEKGTYELKDGKLNLKITERNNGYQKEKIPRQLFYQKMSKKKFKDFEGDLFAYNEKRVGLKTYYIVLTK